MTKQTNNSDPNEYSMQGIDPTVEAKVDALMTQDDIPDIAEEINNTDVEPSNTESAPLLPGEKLPNFDNQKLSSKSDNPTVNNDSIEPPKVLKDEIGIDDRSTNEAVDDIIGQESDRILAIEDAKAELTADGTSLKNKSLLTKIKSKLGDYWANPKARFITISLLFILVTTVAIVPASRYFALNLFGVRAATSLRIIDDTTRQPLKNVHVSVSGKSGITDIEGFVKLEKIKLGKQDINIKKPAFSEKIQTVTFGWGSNPLGDMGLVAVGSKYTFEIKDFLSDKPIGKVEAISGQASATANEKGELVLVVEDQNDAEVKIDIIADKYRSEQITLPAGESEIQQIKLVSNRKQAFISKRSGQFDLYKIDIDGKNEQKILDGTGSEKEEDMIILSHSTKDIIGFVSTRGDKYNKDGFALSSLNIINLQTDEVLRIAQSERVQLIDFIGDKLVFVKVKEGASAGDSSRHRLISYDIETGEEKELASTNYFNDVISANGEIYFTPAIYKVNGTVGLFKVKPDGTGRTTITGDEVWNLFRTSYHKIAVSIQQKWHEYDIGSSQMSKLIGAPAVLKSRLYAESPDGKKSAWVDSRDGKGVLLVYNKETAKEDVVQTQSGLQNPIRWLDSDHLVYRLSNSSEIGDYVVSLSGGEPKKIVDVTDIAGIDRWYYY